MSITFPERLIEFVNLPELKPHWAWDIRLWQLGDDYVISFAADLLRAQHGFSSVYHLDRIQKRFGWNIGVLQNALYSGGFTTVSDMCDAVEALASNYAEISLDNVRCSIMPRQGEPWDPKQPNTYYYSVRKNKVITSSLPPQMLNEYTTYAGEDVVGPVLDWCRVTPKIDCSNYAKQALLTFGHDRNEEIYVASHCFNDLDGLRAAHRECGGLLFPSIAVGLLPSTNFGPFVLIAEPRLPLLGLKPYRTGKGEYPVLVYQTDTWTVTTRQLFGETGANALEEWTGRNFNNLTNRFELLLDWNPHGHEPLRYTRQMLSRLNKLRKKYLDPHLDVSTIGYDDEDRYPYLEAKVNGITPLNCYSMAFCPTGATQSFRRLLRRAGFQGSVFTVPGYNWKDMVDEQGNVLMDMKTEWNYGWTIRNMLLKQLRRDKLLLHHVSYA